MRVPRWTMLIVIFAISLWTAAAQTTQFTYQGSLSNNGSPANGNFDFEFALFDAPSGGGQLGSTLTRSNISVANGGFSLMLDFGSQFPGADRFLEIRVRPAGGGAFTPLSPRQAIASTPYSIKSLNAENAATAANSLQLGGVAAGQYVLTGDVRLSDARNPLPGSGNYIQNTTSTQPFSNFNISGNGTILGTLSANVLNFSSQINIAGSQFAKTTVVGNTFVGLLSGTKNTGDNNTFFGVLAGRDNTTGNENSFFGTRAGSDNDAGGSNSFFGYRSGFQNSGNSNTFFGNETGLLNTTGSNNTLVGAYSNVTAGNLTNATAIGYQARVSQSNSLVLGSINGVGGATANTSVGIGTTAPERKLHIRGAGAQEIMIESSDAGGIKWTVQSSGSAGNGRFEIIDRTANFSRMTILDSGFLGIGTTSPDQRLSVNGNASKASGGTTWAVFSDARLKNIHGKFTPGLSALMKLQPIRFRYRADNPLGLPGVETAVGFSAQEVAKIIPEAVTRSENGFLQLHSDPILWTMLNAIKEQQAQIEAQRAENEKLTTKLDSQQREIDALKAVICERLETAVCRRP